MNEFSEITKLILTGLIMYGLAWFQAFQVIKRLKREYVPKVYTLPLEEKEE